MVEPSAHVEYVLRLADTSLILGQRLSELIGKAPQLEEEMALANIALDLIGQATLLLDRAAELEGAGRTADDLAYRRDVLDFHNHLLVELPNGDFAQTIGRIFLFSAFALELDGEFGRSSDHKLAEIALKAVKEAAYHFRHSAEWVIRLGDGTVESHQRMQAALAELWPYTGELFAADQVDERMHEQGIGADLASVRRRWEKRVLPVIEEATLVRPLDGWMHKGGKDGSMHSEHLGYILAEMQFLQRAYPDARQW